MASASSADVVRDRDLWCRTSRARTPQGVPFRRCFRECPRSGSRGAPTDRPSPLPRGSRHIDGGSPCSRSAGCGLLPANDRRRSWHRPRGRQPSRFRTLECFRAIQRAAVRARRRSPPLSLRQQHSLTSPKPRCTPLAQAQQFPCHAGQEGARTRYARQRIEESTILMSRKPQNAIVRSSSFAMICRHFVTPASPIAPRP